MVLETELLAKKSTETVHGHGGGISRSQFYVVLTGLVLFTVGLIYYHSNLLLMKDDHIQFKPGDLSTSTQPGVSWHHISRPNTENPQTGNGAIKQYPACPIPQLEPFHESIQHLVNNTELPLSFNCTASYPLLFTSTLQSTIIPAKGPDYFRDQGYESCCYRTVVRNEAADVPDDYEIVSSKCYPVHLTTKTTIPDGHEFIAIYCKKKGHQNESDTETLIDVHAFVPLKPKRSANGSSNEETKNKFNVVIFGLDAMSRMNFLRTMPQSYSFLKNELEAVEMFGYNKIGENTGPNMMPMLMSRIPVGSFDNCPIIWKDYSKQGYYTMYSEDGSTISMFNTMGDGFKRQPTDYYLRPLAHFADEEYNCFTCYGPRLTFQFLLDYMEKFVHTMSRNKKSFFQYSWATALTHDDINAPRLGDPHLLKSLRWLKESGHLKNTIFILMSDHGQRMDTIRNTIQGQLEDRLPFLYFVLPESFKRKYRLAYRNLLYNEDKLITTYDLHESLTDILKLNMIEQRKLSEREDDLIRLGTELTRGISLFLPIPEFRTCQMAGIDMIFCSCNYMEVVQVSDPEINDVANVAVSHINSILGINNTLDITNPVNITNTTSTSLCAQVELRNVTMARRAGFSVDKWKGYIINFDTNPGEAQFEAMVGRDIYKGYWAVQGPVVRTNRYGNQSHCVHNINLKPYCYCLE